MVSDQNCLNAGAADIFDEIVYDDDDDYDGPGVEYPHDLPDILSWADSVPSSPASNSGENEISFSTNSTDVSPMKQHTDLQPQHIEIETPSYT